MTFIPFHILYEYICLCKNDLFVFIADFTSNISVIGGQILQIVVGEIFKIHFSHAGLISNYAC